MNILSQELRRRGAGREDNPSDYAGDDQGFDFRGGQGVQEVRDGDVKRENMKGTDRHFEIRMLFERLKCKGKKEEKSSWVMMEL